MTALNENIYLYQQFPLEFLFAVLQWVNGIAENIFSWTFAAGSGHYARKMAGKNKNHGKLLPRASVDARDAGHDARAFRPRPRSDQRPLHGPVRLFDVGSSGVRLQASVASAVRPQGAGRRGSGHGAKPALPVRGGAGTARRAYGTRACASVLTRSTRGLCAGASPGFTRPCSAAGFWTTGACSAISL